MANLPSASYVASTERQKFKESDFTEMEKIDAGGFAIVYKAFNRTFGHVAIKVLNQRDEAPIDCREIDLLLKLSHPHIVTFYGLFVSDYTLSTCRGYVMEYMPTGCLSKVIHDATISYGADQVLSWTRQISLGLAHLHEKTIIHRDIKPQNSLLLGKTLDDLKISDFGTARNHDVDMTFSQFVGTLCYMAPEVFEAVDKRQKYSVSADIYSLGITLWEITRRERPYSHLKIAFKLAAMILQGERPPLDPSPISTDFDGLIQREVGSFIPLSTFPPEYDRVSNIEVLTNMLTYWTGTSHHHDKTYNASLAGYHIWTKYIGQLREGHLARGPVQLRAGNGTGQIERKDESQQPGGINWITLSLVLAVVLLVGYIACVKWTGWRRRRSYSAIPQ